MAGGGRVGWDSNFLPLYQDATLGSGSPSGGLARVTGMDGLLPYPSVASLEAARRRGWSFDSCEAGLDPLPPCICKTRGMTAQA